VEHKAKYNAVAKVDTNLEEARRLAALDAEKKKAEAKNRTASTEKKEPAKAAAAA